MIYSGSEIGLDSSLSTLLHLHFFFLSSSSSSLSTAESEQKPSELSFLPQLKPKLTIQEEGTSLRNLPQSFEQSIHSQPSDQALLESLSQCSSHPISFWYSEARAIGGKRSHPLWFWLICLSSYFPTSRAWLPTTSNLVHSATLNLDFPANNFSSVSTVASFHAHFADFTKTSISAEAIKMYKKRNLEVLEWSASLALTCLVYEFHLLIKSSLYLSEKHSDMKIVCGTKTFPAHKAIVCPQSEYFDKACSGKFRVCDMPQRSFLF